MYRRNCYLIYIRIIEDICIFLFSNEKYIYIYIYIYFFYFFYDSIKILMKILLNNMKYNIIYLDLINLYINAIINIMYGISGM